MSVGKRRRSYGGNRASKSAAPAFQQDRHAVAATNHLMTGSHQMGDHKLTCPACGLLVGTKVDGSMRSHRVGRSHRNAWPCPGNDAAER